MDYIAAYGYQREIFRVLIVPKMPKWQSLNPHNYMNNNHRWNTFSNLSLRRQYLLSDKKNPSKMAS